MWKQSPGPAEVLFEHNVFAPAVFLQVDEGLMRQMLVNWISYVMEFSKSPEKVVLTAADGGNVVSFTVECQGPKAPGPSECHLTMSGYIGQQLVLLLGGKLLGGEADEISARVKFSLGKTV
jgi:hypothetical protein